MEHLFDLSSPNPPPSNNYKYDNTERHIFLDYYHDEWHQHVHNHLSVELEIILLAPPPTTSTSIWSILPSNWISSLSFLHLYFINPV